MFIAFMKHQDWFVAMQISLILLQLQRFQRKVEMTDQMLLSCSHMGKRMDSRTVEPQSRYTVFSKFFMPSFRLSDTRFSSTFRKAMPANVPTEIAFCKQTEPGLEICSPLARMRALQSTSDELMILPGQYSSLREAQGMTSNLHRYSVIGRQHIENLQPRMQMLDQGQHLLPLGIIDYGFYFSFYIMMTLVSVFETVETVSYQFFCEQCLLFYGLSSYYSRSLLVSLQ